jgi:hypothetical protein
MTEIHIDPTSENSLKMAAKQVREYQKRFEEKQIEFVRKLAEVGAEVAKAKFDAALAGYDGSQEPIQVSVSQDGKNAEIIASGQTVTFLEFGAGITHPEHSTHMFQHGTYGKGYGNRRFWVFYDENKNKVKTSGNDPAEAMTGAIQEMSRQATEIAREVFGRD